MFAYKVPYMSILSQKCKYKLIHLTSDLVHLTSDSLSIQTMEQNQIHFRSGIQYRPRKNRRIQETDTGSQQNG